MKKSLIALSILGSLLGIITALMLLPKKLPTKIVINSPQPTQFISSTPTIVPDFCFDAPVLFYHHIQPFEEALDDNQRNLTVAPGNFEAQIRYLKSKGYELVPLEKIVDALLNRQNPGKVAAIILDDGYINNYTYAYPIARRNNVPINIGFVTGFASSYNQLSWAQVKTMRDSGFIYIYNHSWSHQSLHGDNHDTIFKQVTVAQEQLESHLPDSRKIFIYPYGRSGETVISILKDQQFDAAFTDRRAVTHCLSERFVLPRLRTGNFHLSVHGL